MENKGELELAESQDYLEIHYEDQYKERLTTGSLGLNTIIVEKKQNIQIKKNIAAIFRRNNIIEYKSPDDYVSVEFFNETLGYCYLYASTRRLAITDISLTIVESGYPREVIRHIKEAYGWEVAETESGIHQVRGAGMAFPIQFIEIRKLREDENRWIAALRRDLSAVSQGKLLKESASNQKENLMEEYLRVVLAANEETLGEVWAMGNPTVNKLLKKMGYEFP